MIRVENVSKHFRRGAETVRAVDGVSFTVAAGSLALLRGPSGGGKSTLINLCAGLSLPTSGTVTVAGRRLDSLGGRARAALRAKKIAVVFQMFHLVPYLTAMENALLPSLAARLDGAPRRAAELLETLGVAHRARHRPHELSAGERQRVALARALLHRPEVILADEPTGNLDEESGRRVIAMLDACRREGAAVLLVSHQPVPDLHPDQDLLLRDGRL